MKRTPAPVSTASAASIIWSGVGEVNTWPGQAASSMPWPTKPACSGSWPEPPPEISATLPGRNVLRRTNLCSSPSARISAWAATKPSRLSVSTVSTAFINFFMASSQTARQEWSAAALAGDAGDLLDEFVDRPVERRVLLVVAEIRHDQRHMPRLAHARGDRHFSWMRLMVGGEKLIPLGRAEM